ncbi:c-type cytochrome [Ferruginibacter albus]|uniref:c-type cytochrome n=1 Tax=Ferruginibacter albus TaxID=2875540 RepID=UPI001CC4C35F|nr:cytochrome c [Ferruginibacter albus]UAY52171.1 cytochrome c [Ferruginibacter albus]
MKRITFLTAIIIGVIVTVTSCDSKKEPGKVYMPDMAYSRAVETYAGLDSAVFMDDTAELGHKIFYNRLPVDSTIRRGHDDDFPFLAPPPTADANGKIDSTGYRVSESIKNPLPPLVTKDSIEAARLFNINCAVCHGAKAEANGPVAAKIGGVKSIMSAAATYSDGHIYYIMTYGQGNMGSYASQLDRKQRWMIIQFIRSLQPKPEAKPVADSAAVTKK